ncbi:hypothetical protein Dimus_017883, partial [Dionaea muscipula]
GHQRRSDGRQWRIVRLPCDCDDREGEVRLLSVDVDGDGVVGREIAMLWESGCRWRSMGVKGSVEMELRWNVDVEGEEDGDGLVFTGGSRQTEMECRCRWVQRCMRELELVDGRGMREIERYDGREVRTFEIERDDGRSPAILGLPLRAQIQSWDLIFIVHCG